ncbi:AraC family transcriptional regulator [Flavihumibacter fluvii]|uniref:AraC family transcriptional regulator n=1 Tax=Flavihumibacter fluvii TaxID=2838157 RepID=UPI001BDDE4D1|nr:AraC family transcriptional regulator [Flavihumibacter fluvii]ULQ52097.1 AraC family transcriptional regulator [Flavihumibacter fluvii]
MKPQLHKLVAEPDSSFAYNHMVCTYFDKPWHFHKEYELTVIEKSEGTRFIGDQVSLFQPSDMVLIGPNIPHLYRNNEDYYRKPEIGAKSIDIHFTDDFLGNSFFDVPEMKLVRRLLNRSNLALSIHGSTKEYVREQLYEMQDLPPVKRLMKLLDILIVLSTSKHLTTVLNQEFTVSNNKDAARIDIVFQYILKNFRNEIYIEEIASRLNMSIGAFSRYFKHHTRKTFSNYVTEVRISHACRMLIEDTYSVSEIGYMTGFENQSNFYRHFKKYTGVTPKEYTARFFAKQ